MQDHVMKVLIGVAILVIAGTIGLVANDHNTIVVHGERLEKVNKVEVAVDDLRQTTIDVKLNIVEARSEIRAFGKKLEETDRRTQKIEEAVNKLQRSR